MKVSLKNSMENKKCKKTRMAVANAASKKEYKQARHSNLKKEKKTDNNTISKIIITVVIMIVALVLICISGVFNIENIEVEGNTNISAKQIISFSGIEKGTNIFATSKKEIKKRLQENSYINDVDIKKILPNKIKLIIDERKIDYALQLANSYVYINKQGWILEISNDKPEIPIILGFTTDLSNIKPNDRLDEADLKKMNMIIKIMETATNNGIANLITKIDVSNEKDYTIYIETEGKIAYLGEGQELNTRFLYIKSILKEQQGKTGKIFVNMDLNSEYVYFREESI